MIARVGPDALTHRLVAAEAGMPLAATTYWYASKEDLVVAAFTLATDRDLEHVAVLRERSRAWTTATVARELARVVAEACTLRRADSVVGSALWVEAVRRPALRACAQRWTDGYLDFYADLLEQLGDARPAPARARLLSAAVDGLVAQQLAADVALDVDALAAVLAPVLPAGARP